VQALKPDVILLQEADLFAERTGFVDTGVRATRLVCPSQRAHVLLSAGEIARRLQMQCLFACECMPLNSKQPLCFSPASQQLTSLYLLSATRVKRPHGREGNAVLSRFDFLESRGLVVKCQVARLLCQYSLASAESWLLIGCGDVLQQLPGKTPHDKWKTHNCAVALLDSPLVTKRSVSRASASTCWWPAWLCFQGPLEVYSLHLDPHDTGCKGRVRQ
jgi:hypothetical protein